MGTSLVFLSTNYKARSFVQIHVIKYISGLSEYKSYLFCVNVESDVYANLRNLRKIFPRRLQGWGSRSIVNPRMGYTGRLNSNNLVLLWFIKFIEV